MLGGYYSVMAIVAIAVHVITNFKLLAGQGGFTAFARPYRGFLLAVLAYYATDAAWGIFDGLGWRIVLYADTVLYFLALAFVVVMWCRFVAPFLKLNEPERRALALMSYGLLALCVVLLGVNFANGCFFTIDAQGRYVTGNGRPLFFIFLFALLFLMTGFVLAKAIANRDGLRKRNILVFVFGLTLTAAIAFQTAWPLLPFTALGCLVANTFLHTFVIERERELLRKVELEREQANRHMVELEEALERAHSAEKAQRMFFSIVSHDIRTPLNAILGYSELLQSGIEDPAEREMALGSIRASGTTLLQLVNDILDLAKIDAGKMTLHPGPVSLTRLTDEVFSALRMAANGQNDELVDRTACVPAVMLDEARFRQVLVNLVGNAVKFTRNGTVTVAASYGVGNLEVSVIDTGCGIPSDKLVRIMDPFVQVQDPSHSADRAGGTGLGLSICRRIVEMMGGELSVASELGKGSTFKAVIHGVEMVGARPDVAAALAPVSAPKRLPDRVLVVDDSPVNRSVLRAFLDKAGVRAVGFACDGWEALKKLDSADREGHPFDLVLSDFWMPNLNGLEFVEKVRADPRFARLAVFAVTADTETRQDDRAKMFDGILLKPLTYGKLLELLGSAMCAK